MTWTPTRAAALFLCSALLAGCSGDKKRTYVAAAAATSSNTTANPTTNTQPGAPAAPNPGGQIAALVTASAPVNAQLGLGAYQAFQENVSISDLVISAQPGLERQAFIVEDNGTVRVLDLSGTAPQLLKAIDLFGAPLAAGIATGKLNIQSSAQALLTTSGGTGEGVAIFNPLTAQGPADVVRVNLNGITATWPAGTLNSAGVDVGGTPQPMTYTAAAVLVGNKLIYASSNLDASFNNNPGTVTAFDIDLTTGALSGGGFWATSDFNPTALTRVQTSQGEVLLCTNSGAFGQAGGSIDVFDPVSFRKVGVIGFPSGVVSAPAGEVVVSPDGKRGYVASQAEAQVFVIDLENIGQALGNQSSTDLSARYLGGFQLPSSSTTNFVSSIALSHTGNYLYAANFNESALYVIDLAQPALGARVVGFERSGDPASFQGLANKLAVRPGVPGVDFQGPSVFVMTINLAPGDQVVNNVSVVLDAVTVDRN